MAMTGADNIEAEALTTEEAARRLRCHVGTLARWRCQGVGPKYIKRRGRVLYRPADITAFEDEHERMSTREGLS